MLNHIQAALTSAEAALANLRKDTQTLAAVQAAAERFVNVFESGGRIFSCGNGGSMCDAIHFAEELSGRYRKDRRGLPAAAISDPGHISCVANDFGYDEIFSRYVQSHARKGDALLAISTSGQSPNVCKAAKVARDQAVTVVALTGKGNSTLGKLADIEICTPGGEFADRSQELHIKVIHILIELIERSLFPQNYSE